MGIKNLVKNSLLVGSLRLIKENPGKIGLMILFDALFLVFFFVLKRFFEYFAGQFPLPTTSGALYIFIIFTFIYYLLLLFAYSFFKYSLLSFVKSLFDKPRFSLDRLWDFYLLNVIIAGIFFGIMLALNLLLASVKQNYAPYLFILLAIPYALFLYVIVNLAHSVFYNGASIKGALKRIFNAAFTKMKVYRETVFLMIFAAFAAWLVFLGSGYLIRSFTSGNYTNYLIAYSYFRQISIIVIDVLIYLIILINRISFYAAVNYPKILK